MLRRKCFDCKHYIDVVVADTFDDEGTESDLDFYHRSAVAAVAEHKSIACRSMGLTDSIPYVDKSVRYVICRNHFAGVAVAEVSVDFVFYLALYEQ